MKIGCCALEHFDLAKACIGEWDTQSNQHSSNHHQVARQVCKVNGLLVADMMGSPRYHEALYTTSCLKLSSIETMASDIVVKKKSEAYVTVMSVCFQYVEVREMQLGPVPFAEKMYA